MSGRRTGALTVRTWLALLTFGIIGQIAWVVENMYFNVFLYNTITGDSGMIAAMVAASAVVAAVTTLLVGALSDKLGIRKPIIVTGYLLWGLSVMAFALVSVDGLEWLLGAARAARAAAVLVIVLDCVMTFFGSSANDAAFNAWVTDVTGDGNRGRVEAVLAIMPLISMLVVFGALDGLTAQGRWGTFFLIVGGLTMLGGLLGQLLIREPDTLRRAEGKYVSNILYGLRPTVIWRNPGLYLSLLALAVYSASQQVYMPYLIIYIQRFLGFDNYAIILGAVLLAASLISVLFGQVIDRRGKRQVAAPAAAVAFAGLLLMYFARGMVTVIAFGTVMLGASMVLSACLQGLIRDYTPQDKAGQFQGIRILFQVLLPMVTGPFIGSAVIGHTGQTYEDLGVVKEVPTPGIFIASAVVLLLIALPLWLLGRREAKAVRGQLRPLLTPWGEGLDREHPLPEYPRPQLRRDSYLNLNGPWEYAILPQGHTPEDYDGEIVVPFSPESLLSGVNRQLQPGETLWYRRSFTLPADFCRDRILLHFGAVDQVCEVFVNDQPAGEHEGGYLPFALDITDCLTEGVNTLVVAVNDGTSLSRHAYGKQSFTPGGIWYTPQSGIWQTVWMESVPENYVERLTVTPLYDEKKVRVQVHAAHPAEAAVAVRMEGEIVAQGLCDGQGQAEIPLPPEDFRPWSPEDPFLYGVTVTLGGDTVESYFGMRKFGTTEVHGKKVLALNDKPIFMSGVLDQGYWSDGLYTAPSDEAMVYDIQTMKDCGFNMLRKHIKIEPMRWYYHCDRLGMLVWQDMVSGGSRQSLWVTTYLPFTGIHLRDGKYRRFGREDKKSRDQFVRDLYDTVELLYNTPSLVVWVPFNEGWGQFDSLQITQLLWEADPTRLVDHASGWHDQGGGDFKSRHVYFRPVRLRHDGDRVLALSEFGGYSLPVAGHTASDREFGYKMFRSQSELQEALERLYAGEVLPCKEEECLSASVYTQVSDVEDEVNGLLTYDRRAVKVDVGRIKAINRELRF